MIIDRGTANQLALVLCVCEYWMAIQDLRGGEESHKETDENLVSPKGMRCWGSMGPNFFLEVGIAPFWDPI